MTWYSVTIRKWQQYYLPYWEDGNNKLFNDSEIIIVFVLTYLLSLFTFHPNGWICLWSFTNTDDYFMIFYGYHTNIFIVMINSINFFQHFIYWQLIAIKNPIPSRKFHVQNLVSYDKTQQIAIHFWNKISIFSYAR